MSLSDDDGSSLPPPSPSPSPATPPTHKPHCRSKRKKRLSLIDHHNLPTFKPKHSSKPPNPDPSSAPMVTRPCTECGKKFWSWKALFGHMRCHPERQWRGINPPPNLQRPPPPPPPPPELSITAEDHEIAAGLLLLANSSATSMMMRFECSSCKKVFGSRQALGGHRASHKNVKGCFANEEDDEDSTTTMVNNVLEGHRCGICFRVFPSGQALGGHMRCHWDKGDPPPPEQVQQLPLPNSIIIPQFHHHQGFALDLNLPPPPPPPHDSPSAITLDLRLGL